MFGNFFADVPTSLGCASDHDIVSLEVAKVTSLAEPVAEPYRQIFHVRL